MNENIVSVNNLSVSFDYQENFLSKKQKIKAVNNINIKIKKGSFFGLVGESGSGKTTLFNLIQGKLFPDKGDIEIAKNTRIVTVKQEVDDFNARVIDYVVNGIINLKILKDKMAQALTNEDFVEYSKYH